MAAGEPHSRDQYVVTPPGLQHWARVNVGSPGTVFWMGPVWAALCGVLASGAGSESYVRLWPVLLLVMLVAGPVLATMTALALGVIHSRPPQSGEAQSVVSVRETNLLPYALPKSWAGLTASRLATATADWAESVRSSRGQCAVGLVAISALVLLLLGVLGDALLLAVACHTGWLLTAVLVCPGLIVRDRWLPTGSQMIVAWLLGYGVLGGVDWAALALGTIVGALSWAALSSEGDRYNRRLALSYLLQLAAAGILLAARVPISAGALMLLLGAQFLLREEGSRGTRYAIRIQPLVMMVILILSLGYASHLRGAVTELGPASPQEVAPLLFSLQERLPSVAQAAVLWSSL